MPENTAVIKFKANLFTLTILQVYSHDFAEIEQQLKTHIASAPNFFNHAPVILDFCDIRFNDLSLQNLISLLQKVGIIPVGIMADNAELQAQALKHHLAPFSKKRESSSSQTHNTGTKASQTMPSAKIVFNPIRSGQQIYAKNTDLIVLNTVSPGAEVMADGNIHIYGTLFGRALAGVNGNTEARIFCGRLSAELISIAGLYQLSDDFSNKKHLEDIQIYLKDQKIFIEQI